MNEALVATHYYLADRRPFANLSDLSGSDLGVVLAGLENERRAGRQRRPFGLRYMALRRLTEARLRALFIVAGGRPERQAPHYFVLGESRWYEHLGTAMAHVQVPLEDLPPDQTSVTWCDSFTAMQQGDGLGLTYEPRPYHGHVYLVDEVPELVRRYGWHDPDPSAGDWTTWPQDPFVEVQLWTDQPVRAHLT